MTVLREELEVDRPIEEVFAFIADFANSARWDPGVAEARNVTEGPVRVGTRYDLVVLFNDRRLPMTYEVIEYRPPDRVALRGYGSTVNALDDIRFEATPGGTRIRYTADLRLRGLLRVLEPLVRTRFEETGRRAMAGMKAAFAELA
jgi:carbon monoxide dehydrogenase subunit G